ncbi:hypothetical protein ACFQY4_42710 [Catellatospora bangladeshensis]|uniref:SCO6745 family protein n=1 Tax=Catellatospora bangladeshensis TaxID=310355 RepID=UPI0036144F00
MTPPLTATATQTAAMAASAVNRLGGAFLECPRTLRRARELGLTGWACYVAGRGGALGDVRPDTVAAALGLIAPDAVRDGWDAARRALSPREVAAHMLAECCRWGTEHLDDVPRVDRLVELTEKAVLAADGSGLPLFAAWRAMPVPGDGPGARAAVALHLLREHRAGALLLGVRACGLSPVQALVAGPEGRRPRSRSAGSRRTRRSPRCCAAGPGRTPSPTGSAARRSSASPPPNAASWSPSSRTPPARSSPPLLTCAGG